jgi:aminomethyltransferase
VAKSDELNPQTAIALARTPLYSLALEQKARLTAFSGWEMPVQYLGIGQEHESVRTSAGMFDISHMGKFAFQGKQLVEQLQPLVPSDLWRLQPGQAQYTVLLNPKGGILDDIIFYYQGEEAAGMQRGVMIVNASTRVRDKAWILAQIESAEIDFLDLSTEKVLVAIQGPHAYAHFQRLVEEDLTPVKAFEHLEATLLGKSAFIARTGYTGEDGFEVMVDPDVGIELWQTLDKAGVTPCGLGARDTLRLEAAMALYGQDIDETTTPLEAGFGLGCTPRQQRRLYWTLSVRTAKSDWGRKTLSGDRNAGASHCTSWLSCLVPRASCWRSDQWNPITNTWKSDRTCLCSHASF